PGHNSVYFNQSQQISLAELKIACRDFASPCENIRSVVVAGVEYITFESAEPITPKDLAILARLSFVYAVFAAVQDGAAAPDGEKLLFAPVAAVKNTFMDEKISSIFKYPGKTNTDFTRMMINVALHSSKFRDEPHIELLDPVAGKGTTLFEGLVYGFNVSGIEIGQDAVHEACVFFKKNLELEKYKHTYSKRKLPKHDKTPTATSYEFTMAHTKAEFKQPQTTKKLTFIAGNSSAASRHFKKSKFHVIVGDLPYGVAHGNVTKERQPSASRTRNPSELLSACLPAWHDVLRKGGVLVLAFNSFVLSRADISALLQNNGFTVFTDSPYDEFEHHVDRAIKRDIVVAQK
ncbi:TRM11 family SAM-dependent methyltransferase, partial [Chloroflexota bacterium]